MIRTLLCCRDALQGSKAAMLRLPVESSRCIWHHTNTVFLLVVLLVIVGVQWELSITVAQKFVIASLVLLHQLILLRQELQIGVRIDEN
jgi:hypothetical protein